MVLDPAIKAGVIWDGVVGWYNDISGPIQLHRRLSDETVPYELSSIIYDKLKKAGKESEQEK